MNVQSKLDGMTSGLSRTGQPVRWPIGRSQQPSSEVVKEIIDEYKRTGQPARWPVPEHLQSSTLSAYFNNFVKTLAQKSVPEILESYVYFSLSDMKKLLAMTSRYLMSEPLQGVGLDLGGGSGLLASVVAQSHAVEAVLAIELSEQSANLLIPKVASCVLRENATKVVPVIGSFDDLQLPDDSVDFAVEIDAFHHSDNLEVTFSECARVLKPGGWLVCFDRCWPNPYPDWDLERLLNQVYTREFLTAHGYPPDLVISRRDFGEHEYKQFQWQAGFEAAGFELVRMCRFMQKVPFRLALKGVLSVLPTTVKRLLYQTDNANLQTSREWLSQQLKKASRLGKSAKSLASPSNWPQRNIFASRHTTVFLLRKPSR